MKIAFIYDVIYPYVKGGVEKRVWELSVRLVSRGHEVHIFGMKYWDGDDILKKEGVFLHGVCPSRPLYGKGRRTILEAFVFTLFLIYPLSREKFDILDCQQFPYFPCMVTKLVSRLNNTPAVITWIEVWGDYWYDYLGKSGFFGKLIETHIAHYPFPAIAISRHTSLRLENVYGVLAEVIIPAGITCNEIKTILPSGERSDVIFIGRLIREKNADLLILAIKNLLPSYPKIRVIIVGEGPESVRINEIIDENGLKEHIVVHSFLDDHNELIALLKASQVFVLPSVREGFGITALEALACGLPVVTIDHPANATMDLITKETGFLSTLSSDSLAENIRIALLSGSKMRESCIAAAASYNWDSITARLEEYYQEVINNYNH